ncbi:anti-sigma factor [Bosea sp. LjRoot9]|uniref:anti-sigma factor family protein n=1 Tax=Bosea sp. LjRoot9 TaxID=3342341 RepID=UPI003ECC4922
MTPRPITEDDLSGFVDQRLDAERQAEVEAYLDAHPEVAQRIAGYEAQRDLLRAAFAPVAQEPIPPELDVGRTVAERQRPRGGLPRWTMAMAASLLVCAGGLGGWALRGVGLPAQEGTQALAREAAASFAVFASDRTNPVEVRAENRSQLAAWASRQLRRPIAIPDLASSGYRLMGGRVVPTEHGAAALFMYDDDRGSRLVVLARPMLAENDAPMARHSQGGVNGWSWADGGLGYSLVGAVTPELLHPIADDVRRQARNPI